MRVVDLFYVRTGRRITEEDVYNHQGNFPCVTSQTANNGITWLVDEEWINDLHGEFVVHTPCVTWTKDGAKCGTMFYRNYSFYPNDHCGVLIPREKIKSDINLEWFIYRYQDQIKSSVNQQGSQGMLYNNEMAEIDIDYPFPPIEEQDAIVEQVESIRELEKGILEEVDKIDKLLSREIKLDKYIIEDVNTIAVLNKGSNKISEEMIYRNFEMRGIPVYSSATEDEGLMGRVSSECYEEFEKRGNAGELTWTTNGYAGVVFYRESDYLYSEKCGRIVIRKKYKKLVDIKYLYYLLNQITYKYKTAESNNGKLDIVHMSTIPVILPIDKDGNIDIKKQKQIVSIYDNLIAMRKDLLSCSKKMKCLVNEVV